MAPSQQTPDHSEKQDGRLAGLPIQVVGPVDVGRLIRELDTLDNAILQAKLRANGAEPSVSQK